ncbi:hypothetical protein CANCADRAFT_3096 [Tortispora caseinolytica NRRL Y-17796]|uniref:tRNA-splicing endonuclease subunit Sen54 N-terminal domain-containing protein n=1 Tax=Tortispora caseinolytica NRRL Y-17796 TaxID=767744 RepID=A0A1E4TI33_9ASCO|nr:hypothetical protein CANCADRAFT_3096 [Tortispora caseinolytica NRRL Y-17796]
MADEFEEGEDGADWSLLEELPKRGEKETLNEESDVQETKLESSRAAMYRALASDRMHSAKNRVEADWMGELRKARVIAASGTHFLTMGYQNSSGIWLEPEEALYLIERGTLMCRANGVPLSLEGAYAAMIGACSIEKFQVYSNLKRNGYIVRRPRIGLGAAGLETGGWRSIARGLARMLDNAWVVIRNVVRWIRVMKGWVTKQICGRESSAVSGGTQTTKGVYRRLAAVRVDSGERRPDTEAQIDYEVWRPQEGFRKGSPGDADFYIRVLNAEAEIPTLEEFDACMMKHDEPLGRRIKDIRRGIKSVIVAVVAEGVISYMRVAETRMPSVY